jgi:hypothetical protein
MKTRYAVLSCIMSFGVAAYLFAADSLLYAAARPDASVLLKVVAPYSAHIALIATVAGVLSLGLMLGRIGYARHGAT